MNFTRTDLFAVIGAFCLVALLVVSTLHGLSPQRPDRAKSKDCMLNLKRMGIAMHMYFADGTETQMPEKGSSPYITSNDPMVQAFELELNSLSCPAKRKNSQYKSVYVTQKGVYGSLFKNIEHSDSRIVMDGNEFGDPQVHKTGWKLNALFGDGHIESTLP